MNEPTGPPGGDHPSTQGPLTGIPRSIGPIGPGQVFLLFVLVVGVLGFSETVASQQGEPNFVVEIDSTTSPVSEGDPLDVTATVTNTGTAPGTQTVDLMIDQPVEDSITMTLEEGESRTVTLTWQTETGDAGEYDAIVRSEDDFDVADVSVEESPTFTVSIDSTTSPVPEGDPLDVTATVTNTGGTSGSQTVDLLIDESVEDSTTMTLDNGESRSVTLTWETELGDVGEHTATVTSEDDSDSADVTVEEPANFEVSIDSTTSPVPEGDPLDVMATVTNTGGVPGTQIVDLEVDETREDWTVVTLNETESRTIRLTWQTGAGDAGEYTVIVLSEDDSETRAVRVIEPATFGVRIDSIPASVTVGEIVAVTATVTNTGGESATQDIELGIDGKVEDATSITLNGGESRTVTLSWRTDASDIGAHEVTVSSEDDSKAADVTVDEPANFAVALDTEHLSVTEGSPANITTTITNTGDETATQDIELEIDGTVADRTAVTLAGGDSQRVTLTWQTGTGDADERHTATVSSADDSASTRVIVTRPATFEVAIVSVNADGGEGDPRTVTATVRNTGTERGTQEIRLNVDGTVADSTEVTLNGGESAEVILSWQTGTADPGERHLLEVASADDTARREFTPLPEERSALDPPSPESIVGTAVLFGLLLLLAKRKTVVGVITGVKQAVQERLEKEEQDDEDGPPQAIIGAIPTDPAPLRPVLFDASLSYDPKGSPIVRYSWKLEDREEIDSRFVHMFTETGDKTVSLQIWNDDSEPGQSEKEFTVEEKTATLELEQIHPDAPGRDHGDLVHEYLVFTNTGTTALPLEGWTVHDAAEEEGRVTRNDHVFEFEEGLDLAPGGTVTIHTGVEPGDWPGTADDRDRHLFWGKDWPVWNNDEDLIVVQDADRTPVLARRYRRLDGEYVIEPVDGKSLEEWFEDIQVEELEGTEVGARLGALSRLLSLVPGAMFLRGPRKFLISWLVITGLGLVTGSGGVLLLAATMVLVGVVWWVVRRIRS